MDLRLMAAAVLLLLALLAAAGECQRAPAPLPAAVPLLLDLASSSTVISAPTSGGYPALADRLAADLAPVLGHRPRILTDSTPPADYGAGPVLALGNLSDSALLRQLYLQCYDFTDYSWPSPGGSVVRTVRDPLGTGAPVIVLGGSDPAGVRAAAEMLLTRLREAKPQLGYLNLVKLGKWDSDIRGVFERCLGDDDKVWTRVGGAGSWDYQRAIANAGAGYLRTGDERYLPVFRRELRYFLDHYVLNLRADAPPQVHGFINTILVVWDLLRDHPAFTEQERRKFDEDFLYLYRTSEGPSRLKGAGARQVIRDNHGTRAGLDALYGGRFFLRRFGGASPELAAEARQWLQIADDYFAPQLSSSKPVEDNWGHQWGASLFDTVQYALATGRTAAVQGPALREAADRALIAHARGGTPRAYMAAMALAAGDSGYLSGYPVGEEYGRLGARMSGVGNEPLRAFCEDGEIRPRADLLGVAVGPLDKLWYDTIDAAGFNPGDLFAVTVPREQGFDKLSLREGWGPYDYHLLLDGISGGHHAYEDANCVLMLYDAGFCWSQRTGRDLNESGSVKSSNGVAMSFEGAGPGRLHRYARLLYRGESGDYLAVGTALEGVGETDWQRHIVRRRGQWTLVIDRVAARREGEVLAERHWHLRGDLSPTKDGLVSTQGSSRQFHLHLQTAGVRPEAMSGTSDRAEKVRARVRPGTPLEFATLLHLTRDPAAPAGALSFRALEAACSADSAAADAVARLTDLGIVLRRATQPGQWLELPFRLERETAGEAVLQLLGYSDRGTLRVLLDGREVVAQYRHRTADVTPQRVSLGRQRLAAGEHRLRLETVGPAPADGKCYLGLAGLQIVPAGSGAAAEAKAAPAYTLTRVTGGWRIDGGGRSEVVAVGDKGVAGFPRWQVGELTVLPTAGMLQEPAAADTDLLPLEPPVKAAASPWPALQVGSDKVTAVARAADGRLAGGDASGRVTVFAPGGAARASAQLPSAVLSLHFLGDDLLVGEDRGALTRLGPDGAVRWQVLIPYDPMPWDYWSEYRSRVREIGSGDLNGDGQPEILVSNSDRRLYAFTADGKELWKLPVEWGIFTALTTGQFRGKASVLGGTSHPSIHGRCLVVGPDGKLTTALTRPDLVSWSVPSQFRDLRIADVDGDGRAEIITAVDTNCRQLVVYREDGAVLWDADLAGAAEALASAPADAQGRTPTVYCGGASGYVAAFEGTAGKRLWATYLAQPVSLLARRADGRLSAVCASGDVFALRPDGTLDARVSLGSPVSAVIRPGDQRVGERLLLGTADGRLVYEP